MPISHGTQAAQPIRIQNALNLNPKAHRNPAQKYRFDDDFGADTIQCLAEWFYTQNISLGHLAEESLMGFSNSVMSSPMEQEEEEEEEVEDEMDGDNDSISSVNDCEDEEPEPGVSDATLDDLQMEIQAKYDLETSCLVQLWILGDRMLIPKLQNAALLRLDSISEVYNRVPDKMARYVFERTGAGSKLREWFVFVFAFEGGEGEMMDRANCEFISFFLHVVLLCWESGFRKSREFGFESLTRCNANLLIVFPRTMLFQVITLMKQNFAIGYGKGEVSVDKDLDDYLVEDDVE
jgi:hypothetical protein